MSAIKIFTHIAIGIIFLGSGVEGRRARSADDANIVQAEFGCQPRKFELWIHTCWGNPNMQRVMEDTSYANSIEIYLERCRGDVWTLEMKDRNQRDIELFAPFRNDLKKKICIGAVSHRTLQADRAEDVAGEIRKALAHIPVEQLVVSSDCGFGRQGCNREIAFYKASAIAQGCNIVRAELGLPTTYIPATNPQLQTDVVERDRSV